MEAIRKTIERFGNITDSFWEEAQALFRKIEVVKGERLQQQGDISQYAYFIESGLLRYYYLKDGSEYIRQFFFERAIVSDLVSGLGDRPSNLYIDAVEDSTLWAFPVKMINQLPKLKEKVFEDSLFHVSNRMASIFLDSPEEKYLQLRDSRPKVMQRIPQYMIASYIGVTPEGLSRIKKRIADRERS